MTTKGRTRPLKCIRRGKKKTEKAGKPGTTDEERRAYWSAKEAAARVAKETNRKARNKLRAAARKSAKQGFSGNRTKDRRPTLSEVEVK